MKSKLDVRKRIKDICNAETAVKLIFTAFLLVSLASAVINGGYSELALGAGRILPRVLAVLGVSLALLAVELFFSEFRAVEWVMLGSALAFSASLIAYGDSEIQYRVFLAVLAAMLVVVSYVSGRGTFDKIPKDLRRGVKWSIACTLALFVCAIVAAIGVCRYLSFAAPNYDFGIWCNMFHNMKESGLPNTTCERDGMLSHFAVHFSPIYYLMLPFYFVFPYPETLQILQAVVLYSGIVPLCLLAKEKGISDRAAVLVCFVYAFYPAIATGTFYDLHENCFLLPLLLWCFLFFEKEKPLPMWIFAALTLLVKEDAFVYLLVFAVYVFFLKGKKKTALAMALASVLYFIIVSSLMRKFGNGIMVGRYDNLIADKADGLFGVVKTLILNPGYLFTQIFVSKDGDGIKLIYIVQLLFTLGLIPFATRKISRYLLVAPILMNLITMYVYQPNISFQYSFGITAFLFYVTLLNLSELGDRAKKIMLPTAAVASLLLFVMLVTPKFGYYTDRYVREKDIYRSMESVLEMIPDDASVTCSTFLLPHIADRGEIYEVTYHKENGKYKTDTDFAVLDMRYKDESQMLAEYFLEEGYDEYHREGYILILKKNLDN